MDSRIQKEHEMTRSTTYISIKGTVLRETEKAVQFRIIDIGGEEIDPIDKWIPFSQTEKRFTDPHSEDEDTMMISEWIADKLGLI